MIEAIQFLSLKPGDALVVNTEMRLNSHQVDELKRSLRKIVPDESIPIIILDLGIRLTKVTVG